MPGKNIGIAQPRSNPSWGATPHNRVAVTQGNFTSQRTNSVINSYFTSGSFGTPSLILTTNSSLVNWGCFTPIKGGF